MKTLPFTECVDIVGSSCRPFEGKKKYVSTGAVDTDHIDYTDVEIIDYHSKPSRANLEVNGGDVLFAKMQGTKKTLLIDTRLAKYIYSTGFCAVKARTNVLTDKCLYHLLTSEMFLKQKDRNCSGATQKAITNVGLNKIMIRVPDINIQDAIATQLDKITSVITKRQLELVAFDDLIKARFVEMFGDVIHNDMKWPKYKFSTIASSRLGKMLDAKQQTGKYQYPYLANFNVQWFKFELKSLNKMDFDEDEQIEFELLDGDLLVCEGGEIGRCAVWHNEINPCYFQKALHRVRCNTSIITPEYLARWFQFNCKHDGFAAIEGAKATIAHLPGAKLKALEVVVPSLELQNEFAAFVSQVEKTKATVQKSLDQTQLLFDSLMQQYFG